MKKLIVAILLSLSFIPGVPVVAFASPATNSATSSSAMCVFEAGVTQNCQSTNPHIVLNLHNSGDTSQCTFALQVNWGDGSAVQNFTVRGGPDGSEHLSDHVYSASPGTYQINMTGSVLSGSCTFTPASYQFTLLPSSCPAETAGTTPDYCVPADWNTQYVNTLTPGVEPLNVIISARSNVPLNKILAALSGWEAVAIGTSLPACISPENANVTGRYVVQQESWRLEGCKEGNVLSVFGKENHARLWNQPVPGSQFGAWFISASYETACFIKRTLWHCIDGGPHSFGKNGYDRGAASLATELVQAAHKSGWYAVMRTDPRPAGVGENGVAFSSAVYVVTVDYTLHT